MVALSEEGVVAQHEAAAVKSCPQRAHLRWGEVGDSMLLTWMYIQLFFGSEYDVSLQTSELQRLYTGPVIHHP